MEQMKGILDYPLKNRNGNCENVTPAKIWRSSDFENKILLLTGMGIYCLFLFFTDRKSICPLAKGGLSTVLLFLACNLILLPVSVPIYTIFLIVDYTSIFIN